MSISGIRFVETEGAKFATDKRMQFRCYVKFVLFDSIILRDCRILSKFDDDGTESLVLMFPDKTVRVPCPHCKRHRNSNIDRFCGGCGLQIRDRPESANRTQVAHPANHGTRRWIEDAVFAAYRDYLADPVAYTSARIEEFEAATGLTSRVRQLLRSEA